MTIKHTWLVAGGATDALALRWIEHLDPAMQEYKIALTKDRVSMFLAQVLHECNGLRSTSENLNYSAEGLMKTWPKRFPVIDIARQYEHQPDKIANFVYAGRLGNGDPSSGDGWKFRGRGLIQITGRANYLSAEGWTGIKCTEYPDLLELPQYAARVACAYWSVKGLNALADAKNFDMITQKINGGQIGRVDRLHRLTEINLAM